MIYKRCLVLALVFGTLVGITALAEEELCGNLNQSVCLQNSATVTLVNNVPIPPGSVFVLTVPGVSVNARFEPSGQPTVPFRLEDHGSVTDNLGGVWGPVKPLAGDSKGFSAISFTLLENTLNGASQMITLKDIRVCQLVSDEPGLVNLSVSFYQNTNGKKESAHHANQVTLRFDKNFSQFSTCKRFAGHLPLLQQGHLLAITNPHDERVLITLDDERIELRPNRQLLIDASFGGSAFSYTCNRPLPMVLFEDGEDLSVTALDSRDNHYWVVPHLARDASSWENAWVFASGESVSLTWAQGDDRGGLRFQPGVHQLGFEVSETGGASWLQVHGNRAHNGYLSFRRHDERGEAWVNAVRIDPSEAIGSELLYLPHIAMDRVNFWTGFSLANQNEEAVSVRLTGYAASGALAAEEVLTVQPQSNLLGVIGTTHLLSTDQVAWAKLEADAPITGIALIGSNRENGVGVSGILLPNQGQTEQFFPLLRTDGAFWSGLTIANPSADEVQMDLEFFDSNGRLLESRSETLQPHEKQVTLVPRDSSHAVCRADGELLAYAFIGVSESGKIGGYLGQVLPEP